MKHQIKSYIQTEKATALPGGTLAPNPNAGNNLSLRYPHEHISFYCVNEYALIKTYVSYC